MPQPYRIIDLQQFSGLPTGNEIAEVSAAGMQSSQIPLAVLASGRAPTTVAAPATVTVSSNAYGDVLVTTNAAVIVNLPASASRQGVPVSIVAVTTLTPNITINPNGAETIMGLASITITSSYGAFTLWPLSTGGWYQK
jgi:hypothetical protein